MTSSIPGAPGNSRQTTLIASLRERFRLAEQNRDAKAKQALSREAIYLGIRPQMFRKSIEQPRLLFFKTLWGWIASLKLHEVFWVLPLGCVIYGNSADLLDWPLREYGDTCGLLQRLRQRHDRCTAFAVVRHCSSPCRIVCGDEGRNRITAVVACLWCGVARGNCRTLGLSCVPGIPCSVHVAFMNSYD